jgi:hypothetical protein
MGQSGRYEMKYLVEEDRAVALAEYAQQYLRPSAHNGFSPLRGHPVVSLYMDSPDFFFFRQGFCGHKNKIKLRIRFYDDEWTRPAFLEIKRRVGDVVCKDRAMITREGVRQFLNGGWPQPSYWPDPAPLKHGRRRMDVYEQFWHLANRIHAKGMIYVSYVREIFEAPDDEELRVTLDRHIRATPDDGSGELHMPTHGYAPAPDRPPYYIPPDGVVLELKYEGRAPVWMTNLVKIFNLERRAICKYCALIDAANFQWGGRVLPEMMRPLLLCDRSADDTLGARDMGRLWCR